MEEPTVMTAMRITKKYKAVIKGEYTVWELTGLIPSALRSSLGFGNNWAMVSSPRTPGRKSIHWILDKFSEMLLLVWIRMGNSICFDGSASVSDLKREISARTA